MHVKATRQLVTACLIASASLHAHAQAPYPVRSLELTVPYGAGGATDVVARRFAALLEKELGQSVVVTNRPGAQGTLQLGHLARTKPDGYVIGMSSFSALTYTMQRMSQPPFQLNDFTYLGEVGTYAYGLVVPARSPIQNLDDYVAAARQPKGITYGVTGAPNNIPYATLARTTGGVFEEVNYKSGLEAVTATAGGHVDSALQNPQDIIPLAQAGQVRLIASMTDTRIDGFEDVPTAREQGYDLDVYSSLGLAAPKGLPDDVRQTLQTATLAVLRNPAFVDFMKTQHMRVNVVDGPTYAQMVRDGHASMGKFIQEMKIPMIN